MGVTAVRARRLLRGSLDRNRHRVAAAVLVAGDPVGALRPVRALRIEAHRAGARAWRYHPHVVRSGGGVLQGAGHGSEHDSLELGLHVAGQLVVKRHARRRVQAEGHCAPSGPCDDSGRGGPLGADDHVRASIRGPAATDRLLQALAGAVGER